MTKTVTFHEEGSAMIESPKSKAEKREIFLTDAIKGILINSDKVR